MTTRFWNVVYRRGHLAEKVFWTIFGYLGRLRDLFRLGSFDVVYIFLWVTPFGPAIFERLFALINPRIVYDIDDMVFLGHASSANPIAGRLKGRTKMPVLMKKARQVIVCTPGLHEYAKRLNAATTDISSTINTGDYWPLVQHSAGKRPIVVGWSGSHSTSKYVRSLEPVLAEIQRRFGVTFLVIGDENFRLSSVETTAIPWRRETEVLDLSRIDIGIYPLPDEEWVHGKSGLKALQYMALGIPTVATAIGANFRVIEDGVSGFLVNTEQDWTDRLISLIEDAELRSRLGLAGRRRVEEKYSVEANQDVYLRIIEEAAGG